MSKSSFGPAPGGRKLFWVCEETLKDELLEYIYSYTPEYLLKSASVKLVLPDLFRDEEDRKAWQALQESVCELQASRLKLQKEQRNIRLGMGREHFLLGKHLAV